MELLKIKTKIGFTYRMNYFPQSITNGKLEYWTNGEGYKKTVKFEVIQADLPDRCNPISWYQICKIYDTWGYDVAFEYGDTKTCTMMVNSQLQSRYQFYLKAKDLLSKIENPDSFFELLQPDYFLSICGTASIDIVEFDKTMAKLDSEYDDINATYQGKEVSLSEYLCKKFSPVHSDIVSAIIEA
jgi:hypothetical protein